MIRPVHRPPQGRPVLVQAGRFEEGRDFAAGYADVVFAAADDVRSAQAFHAEHEGPRPAQGPRPEDAEDPAGDPCRPRRHRSRREGPGTRVGRGRRHRQGRRLPPDGPQPVPAAGRTPARRTDSRPAARRGRSAPPRAVPAGRRLAAHPPRADRAATGAQAPAEQPAPRVHGHPRTGGRRAGRALPGGSGERLRPLAQPSAGRTGPVDPGRGAGDASGGTLPATTRGRPSSTTSASPDAGRPVLRTARAPLPTSGAPLAVGNWTIAHRARPVGASVVAVDDLDADEADKWPLPPPGCGTAETA